MFSAKDEALKKSSQRKKQLYMATMYSMSVKTLLYSELDTSTEKCKFTGLLKLTFARD